MAAWLLSSVNALEDTSCGLLILSCSFVSSLVLGIAEVSWVLPVGAMSCGCYIGCELGQGVLQQPSCAGQGLAEGWLVLPRALEMSRAV